MSISDKNVELRISHSAHAHVAVLGRYLITGKFERLFNQFYSHSERLSDGRKEQVHMLPDHDLTYEILEVLNGERIRWYAATLEGDPALHRISIEGAKMHGRREMPLRQVVVEYPERPKLADFDDEED